ncbi:transcriptional repressor [Acetobacteraceae bacterium KSS8]|uniref:Transcriptional repressor n=1 Tax=Endosaccharibacter trunci TaxID=2812733 RepID=A0ABT1W8L2_9PROT|nr:transcriptional repressor [Acetobacteraceae bacterium KSS8]
MAGTGAMMGAMFGAETGKLLDRAARTCDRNGSRLTDIRRHVLGLVLDSDRPVGAYDLLDRLRQSHKGAAPPTVYRALDFLQEQGLIHKVERLSAFVGCVQDDRGHDHAHHDHKVQFLICSVCQRTVEIDEPRIADALEAAAARHGFVPRRSTIELEGLCADCVAEADRAEQAREPG